MQDRWCKHAIEQLSRRLCKRGLFRPTASPTRVLCCASLAAPQRAYNSTQGPCIQLHHHLHRQQQQQQHRSLVSSAAGLSWRSAPTASLLYPRSPTATPQQQRLCVRTMATGSSSSSLSFEVVDIDNPKELNFILGHAHFIMTVEDLYEALVRSSPALKFGIAFNEASPGYEAMPGRKVRFDGNDPGLTELAKKNAMALGAGHTFIIFIDGGFPINCLNAVKAVPEVCRVHCATANPTRVIIAKTSDDEKGIMGVIDGVVPTDFETEDDKKKRHDFLRMIGYKR